MKLKIGMVCRFPPEPCGIAATYASLVPELRKLAEVVRIGSKGSDAEYRISFSSWGLKRRLREIVEKEKLDILHIHYIAPYYGRWTLNQNLVHSLSLDIPKVVTLHEVQFPESLRFPQNLRKWILDGIERQVVRKADAVIAHTPGQAAFINRKYRTKKAGCILYGLEPRKRKRKKEGKRLVFFGILSPNKGVEDLVKAMELLPGFSLEIVGAVNSQHTKAYAEMLEKKVEGKENIRMFTQPWFLPKERDAFYKDADAIVLPYRWAPYQSAVVTDAGSQGLPVIVTRVGSLWEVVERFGCGVIVPPRNPGKLAEGIKDLFRKRGAVMKGLEKYRKAASWKTIARNHLEIYKGLGEKINKGRKEKREHA